MKIFCAHLRNDFSGSPRVLSAVLRQLASEGYKIELLTAGKEGFLSGIKGVTINSIPYQLHSIKLLTLIHWMWSQLIMFLKICFAAGKHDIVYVNTLMPFGAALAGKLKGAKVIYHLHEVAVRPRQLHGLLTGIAARCAHTAIYVSDYLREVLPMSTTTNCVVIHNTLDEQFTSNKPRAQKPPRFTALMLCSLRDYKGVWEFLDIADQVPEVDFKLVVPESPSAILKYFEGTARPLNLEITTGDSDIRWHYASAHLLMQLSRLDGWIESFGMTILEGMHFGLPAIVPPEGGPVEQITEGYNGYLIDSTKTTEIAQLVRKIYADDTLYKSLSAGAQQVYQHFDPVVFRTKVSSVFSGAPPQRMPEQSRMAS